jgi:glycosyltransferase involved in cell wall biosynthesis
MTGKNTFIDKIILKYEPDGVYPLQDYPVKTISKARLVSWYADLQHKYYPEFFTLRKILERNARIKLMLNNTGDLVVSSREVANDFIKFFSPSPAVKMHIFHFVSVIEDIDDVDIVILKKKYSLPDKYFIISNQFHKHKNHRIVLKAIGLLREKGIYQHFAFTGKFPDDKSSPYISELRNLIEKTGLKAQISFLGVIPRVEQLALMKHSQAVIQPSLFEGWSTVIEDARSLQVPVIASSIAVNIEQLGTSAKYFDPENEKQLAEILESFPERKQDDIFYEDYFERVRNAARIFIDIFRK